MPSLLLGIRMSPFDFQRVKIDDVNFEMKVKDFQKDVSEKTNLPRDSFELVFRGSILDVDATLSACSLKPGVMVHVLKKKAKAEPPRPSQTMSELDIQALVVAFRTLNLSPSYKNALQKLRRPDILDNIVVITPGLSQDPAAIALIQDPELLVRIGDIETVRRIVEIHPALAEAANHIAAAVHEEAVWSGTNGSQPSTSSAFSLLELFSDEEDMESSQSSDSTVPQGLPSSVSTPITAAQVAVALASISQGNSNSSESTSSSGGITEEMLNQAMHNVMSSISPPNASSAVSPPADPVPSSLDNSLLSIFSVGNTSENMNLSSDLTEQMHQMRELGLTDDAVNLQALQISGGNVHAAVDLVFSGAISPNDSL